MTDDASRPAAAVDGAAVVALLLALLSVGSALTARLILVSTAFAVAAVAAALVSRRRLRRDPALRGARAGLAAFLLGGAVMLVQVLLSVPLAFFLLLDSGDA